MKWNSIVNTKPPHGIRVQVKIKVISSAVWNDKFGAWTDELSSYHEITHWREIPNLRENLKIPNR